MRRGRVKFIVKAWPLLFLPLLARSTGWSQEQTKVGVVDVQRVISESRPGKQAKERFHQAVKKTEADLLKEKRELEALRSDLDKKGLLLREEEKSKREKEFQRRYRDYLHRMEDSEADVRQRENQLLAKILAEVREVIQQMGEKEQLTLILERSQILYSDNAVDYTDRVIERYNSRTAEKGATSN